MADIDTAQDLAEALRALIDETYDSPPRDVIAAVYRAETLLASLSYDEEGSASSQNYIDTGVRLLARDDPHKLVAIPC